MPRWRWLLGRVARRIWFRATIISLLSVCLALASAVLAPFIPYSLSLQIGSEAVDDILTILASSMLAVTTFSLTAMVAAFSGAAQHVTPRATQLLIEDDTAQNALSTFLGTFLFAIVGLIALSTGLYGSQGRVILFVGTILLIIWIAVTLLRWIQRLTTFGRVEDAVERVEKAAFAAIARNCGQVLLAGKAEPVPPAGAHTLWPLHTGYVTHLDRTALARKLEESGARLTVAAPPGRFVDPSRPLGWTNRPIDAPCRTSLAKAFTIDRQRDFEHDPRFGMVVLAEIASRALSPAINDPGTAIAVLDAGQRIVERLMDKAAPDPLDTRIADPPLAVEEMLEDLLLPVIRDGARIAEVGIRVQHLLASLSAANPPLRPWLARMADRALDRARSCDMAKGDVERLETARRPEFNEQAQARITAPHST